jgi:hypothetical protein
VITSRAVALAVFDRMRQISVANGFETDIGLKAFRGRRRLEKADLPCSVLIEAGDRVADQRYSDIKVQQRYILEGHSECDPLNPNDKAHEIIADLKKAIFVGDATFGKQVKGLRYISRLIAPRDDGVPVISAAIEIELEFVENLAGL